MPSLRERIVKALGGSMPQQRAQQPNQRGERMYHNARPSRLTAGWGYSTSSADAELVSSLRNLRDRSRALVRDASYAKRARQIVVNNVIGSGVALQAQVMSARDKLRGDVNDAIEAAWTEWSRAPNCHTGGQMHFCDLERAAMAQVFEAGEAFIRVHLRRFGESAVPLGLELIESERLADEFSNHPMPAIARGSIYRMGVELDEFYRPLAYLIHRRHAGEIGMRWSDGADQVERVPADEIFHLRIISRWPQTRGEPWLHAVARRLNDMDGYAEAEITAARGAASYLATIETPDGGSTIGEEEEDGVFQAELTPGIIEKLMPGEKLNFVQPNRPNTALDPFMRYMLREVAAGAECSYESLSRDYSQSNYSSSRLALLDDRDTWRALQQWWIRNFREPLHRKFMQQAVLARAIQQIAMESYALDVAKYAAVRFKPRGWTWIDPTKEVEAFERAVRDGFITTSDVIAQTGNGRDLEDVLRERERELGMMKDAGLVFDTDPSRNAKGDEVAPTAGEATAPQRPPPEQEQGSEQEDEQRSAAGRLEAVGLGIATALGRVLDGQRELARRPDPAPPVVNVAPPAVHIEAPITVQVPDTRDEHVEVVERDENGLSKRMIIRREAA